MKRSCDGLLLLAIAVAGGAWTRDQLLALGAHRAQWAQDLAFFDQILHSATQGGPWTSSLLLEPTGFWSMVHFHPVFALLLPLYALVPGPATLVAVNAFAVASAAWPLARLGDRAGPSFALCAGVAFLVWIPVQAGAVADFRPMALWVPALAWVLHGLTSGRWGPLVFGAALCCLSREESGYVLPALGAVAAVWPLGGSRRPGAVLVAIGLAWLGFLLLFKENLFFHFDPRKLLDGGGGGASPELVEARVAYLRQSFLGGWLLAPLAPQPLAMSLAPMGWLWADTHREWHGLTGTYVYLRSALLPLFAGAGILGAARLVRGPRSAVALGLLMVVGNLFAFPAERERFANRRAAHAEEAGSPEVAAIDGLIARLHPDDAVATDYRLIASVSGRAVLWNAVHLYLDDGQPPHWQGSWPLTVEAVDTLLVPVDDPVLEHASTWSEEARGGGYVLLRAPVPG